MVDVSVVIPCYNGARTLGRQLGALAAQSEAPDFEVLVVDNRSTDGSRRVAEEWGSRLTNLRVLDASERAGAAYARNAGVSQVRGAVVLFCDADDEVSETWVRDMARALEGVDVASGWLSFDRLNPAHLRTGKVETDLPRPLGYLPTVAGSNLGLRRETYLGLGGMDESFPLDEDVDLAWRSAEAGLTVACVPAVVHYRLRATPRAVFRQFRGYSSALIMLWVRYQDRPVRPVGMRGSVVQLARQLGRIGQLLRGPRARWEYARDLGSCVGAIEGHLRYRMLGSVPGVRLMEAGVRDGES